MHIDTKFISDGEASQNTPPTVLKSGLGELQQFADRRAEVGRLLRELEEVCGKDAKRAVGRLRKELEDFEPSITLLGQVKSGKTTLVNALAGQADLLPSDVNPWTSVVTSLHLVAGRQAPDIRARFGFMREDEWDRLVQRGGRLGEIANRAESDTEMARIRDQIEALRDKSRRRLGRKFELLLGQEHEYGYFDKDLLERYICIGDDFFDEESTPEETAQGRFADITRSADLYMNSDSVPLNLCFRDTPGVNDTFMMREQVTINAIRSSRLCVVVLSAHQALTSVDMALIRMISSLKSRDVVIFVNRIDELADPATQIPDIEASIRRVLSEQNGPEDAQIVFGSAYWMQNVLNGTIDEMRGLSADSLLSWAESKSDIDAVTGSTAEMVWQLAGLPELFRIISQRIVEKLADPLLDKIVSSAITVASGQQAANKVPVVGGTPSAAMGMHTLKTELDKVLQDQKSELTDQVDALVHSFQERAIRAHTNFVANAAEMLIAHLEKSGEAKGWNHDPSSLRAMLKSAYSVFASRARTSGRRQYEAAVTDIAGLYYAAFGKAVEGIELQVPDVEEFPPPVALAQTIALDLKDGWWSSWWKSKRGHKAFVDQYRAMIAAETEDFMTQLMAEQTQCVRQKLIETMEAFFEQNRDIMLEISISHHGRSGVESLFSGEEKEARLNKLDAVLHALRTHLADVQEKGKSDA